MNSPQLRRFASILLSAIAVVLFPAGGIASCGSSSCPLDLHALGLTDNSKLVVDLSFQYIHQDRLLHGSSRAHFGEVPTEHDEISTINRLTTLQLRFLATPDLQISATVPFVSRSHDHIATSDGQFEQWNFGAAGDASLQGRYRVFRSDRPTHDSFWVSGGLKFATGARHERGTNGEEAEVPLQPGSGSTDFVIGAAYEGGFVRETPLLGFLGNATAIPWFASVSYRRNGAGTFGYRRGDELQANLGSEYPLSQRLRVVGQINARQLSRDHVGETGENPALTGGTFVYASPGLRLELPRRLSAYGFVQLPVYQNVNGVQLTARINFLAGIQQRF